jgi:hypothetical protein
MSGGNDTVTQSNFPSWAEPYAKDFLSQSQQVASLPYKPYTGSTVAQLNPYQTGAFDAIAQRAYTGSPVNSAASGELTKTLSGGYLNSNPYLDDVVNRSLRDVTNQFQGVEARAGSFGNAGVTESMARGLGDVSSQIRGQDYANERNRMVSSIGLAPTIANQDYLDAEQLLRAGQGYQTQEQLNLDDQYKRFQEAQNYPKEQLGTLGKALGLNYGSTSQVPGNNSAAQGLGTALALYGGYKGLSSSGGGSK